MKRACELPTCTVCYDNPMCAIYACKEGHMTCIDCISKGKITKCPTCSISFNAKTRNRCRFQEDMIAEHTTACTHCGYKSWKSDDAHKTCPEYENRKVSCTFANGITEYYEGIRGKEILVRTEFAAGHENHGEIRYFENGEHVRTEFKCGIKKFFENGKCVRWSK